MALSDTKVTPLHLKLLRKTGSSVFGNVMNELRLQIAWFARSVLMPLLMVKHQCQRRWASHPSCCWSCWPDLCRELPSLKELYSKWGDIAFNCLCDILVSLSLLRPREMLSEMLSDVITSVSKLTKLWWLSGNVSYCHNLQARICPPSLVQIYFFFLLFFFLLFLAWPLSRLQLFKTCCFVIAQIFLALRSLVRPQVLLYSSQLHRRERENE